MKKSIIAALLAVFALALPACGGADAPAETTTAPSVETTIPAPAPLSIVADGKTEYRIVRSENASQPVVDAVVELAAEIKARTGAQLVPTTDWESEHIASSAATDYEIIVGDTSRNGKYFTYDTESLGTYDYVITVADQRVLILGGSNAAAVEGVAYFIANCLPPAGSSSFTFDAETHILQARELSEKMTVMSLNLLATDTEYAANPSNDKHLIKVRQPRINAVILDHMPDSIGLQECSATWRQYFDSLDKTWSYDRVGADKNQKISILYNTDTVSLIDAGSIWLTEDPENLKISVEWKGNTERLAHYAVLEVKASGERYVHVNTHIGFDNADVAMGQAKVVRDYCEKLHKDTGYPVVCTGDFNFTLESDYYKAYMEGIMDDTRDLAAESATGTGSFNKMGASGYPKAYPIDQVMVSEGDWDVYTYEVDYTTFDGCYYSDHYAVVATMTLRK